MVSRAKQFLKETAPSLFYHASFTANKNDILDNGLSSGLGHNWKDWSEKGYIYLDVSPRKAANWLYHYMVENEDADIDDIVVFKVDCSGLNIKVDVGTSRKYKGNISKDRVSFITEYEIDFSKLERDRESFHDSGNLNNL